MLFEHVQMMMLEMFITLKYITSWLWPFIYHCIVKSLFLVRINLFIFRTRVEEMRKHQSALTSYKSIECVIFVVNGQPDQWLICNKFEIYFA